MLYHLSHLFPFLDLKKGLLISLFLRLCWVFVAVHGLSLVSQSWGYSLVAVHRPHIALVSLFVEHGLWGAWVTVVMARRCVESSRSRDQIHVLCIGRQILNHWTTREALHLCPFSYSVYKITQLL